MTTEPIQIDRPDRVGTTLRASVRFQPNVETISYTGDLGTDILIEPFLATVLLPAMTLGRAVRVSAPVSSQFLDRLPEAQRMLANWDPALRVVDMDARGGVVDRRFRRAGTVGSFFSGGVDSFFTVLRHRDRLDYAVFVYGVNSRLRQPALHRQVRAAIRRACRELGLQLVEVTTNAPAIAGSYSRWRFNHGAVLAGIAHTLVGKIGTMLVPGSLSHDSIFPYGSHPSLDPLLSTEAVEIRYDGIEANRYEKTAAVATNETVLRFLRVCNNRADPNYNCGMCEKCLRTMVALHISGSLASCATFPSALDLPRVAGVIVPTPGARQLWEQNLAAAVAAEADEQLVDVLRLVVRRAVRLEDRMEAEGRHRLHRRRSIAGV